MGLSLNPVSGSGAGMGKADGRAQPRPGFCQGAVTKERKVELWREFTLGHVRRAKEQRLAREERGAGRRPGVTGGGSQCIQIPKEAKEWAVGEPELQGREGGGRCWESRFEGERNEGVQGRLQEWAPAGPRTGHQRREGTVHLSGYGGQ